jgi:outer membrane protein assembly factor BamA
MRLYTVIVVSLLGFLFLSAAPANDRESKKFDFAFIPIVSYNRSFGAQLGALANGYFNISRSATVSPASMVGLFGNGFTNKTYFAGLFNKMYLREDHWRTKIALGFGDIKFQTFVEVPPGVPEIWAVDDNGEFIDYSTNIAFAYAEGMALAGSRIYLGLRLVYSGTETVFDSPLKPDETTSLFGFGFAGEYDVRDNVFTPFEGMNIKLKTFTFLEALGSSDNYNRITFDVNKYIPVRENATLLLRFFSNISFGKDVPFVGKNVVGRDDLRGYTDGRYRANQVYDIQGEYRWNFYGRWGMVAFGGAAIATDDFSGTNYSGLLPAAGAGIRFKFILGRNINIGVDIAAGKDDWGLYFRIGEAFTR